MPSQPIKLIALIMFSMSLWGCNNTTPKPVDFSEIDMNPTVEIRLKLDDKNIEGALLSLQAKSGTTPKLECRFDSESNVYTFLTVEGGQRKAGVPEGEYTLVIKQGRNTKAKIPGKYSHPGTSDLVVVVKPDVNNALQFELN